MREKPFVIHEMPCSEREESSTGLIPLTHKSLADTHTHSKTFQLQNMSRPSTLLSQDKNIQTYLHLNEGHGQEPRSASPFTNSLPPHVHVLILMPVTGT